jgi:hypothetical protein
MDGQSIWDIKIALFELIYSAKLFHFEELLQNVSKFTPLTPSSPPPESVMNLLPRLSGNR